MIKPTTIATLLASTILLAAPALAVDGVVLIDQANALAGNVTPGDTPGYPVTLSLPGSYRLSGNLASPNGVNGINATAPEVSIDLNGFRMLGFKSVIGIHGTQRGLVVRNGTIRGFASNGILAAGPLSIIEDMSISANGGDGVLVTGPYTRILNSTIANNANGIRCDRPCHIEGNYIAANVSYGIRITIGTILGNTIQGNTGAGIWGPHAVGFGNNTIVFNGGTLPGIGLVPLHPNFCFSTC